jgi:hypothetical protein
MAKMSFRTLLARAKFKLPDLSARRRLCVVQAHDNIQRCKCIYAKSGQHIGQIRNVQIRLRIRKQISL